MEEKKREVITVDGIVKRYGISRATFYQQYRKFVDEVPATGKKCLYDFQSVEEFHQKRVSRKLNSNYKIIA